MSSPCSENLVSPTAAQKPKANIHLKQCVYAIFTAVKTVQQLPILFNFPVLVRPQCSPKEREQMFLYQKGLCDCPVGLKVCPIDMAAPEKLDRIWPQISASCGQARGQHWWLKGSILVLKMLYVSCWLGRHWLQFVMSASPGTDQGETELFGSDCKVLGNSRLLTENPQCGEADPWFVQLEQSKLELH